MRYPDEHLDEHLDEGTIHAWLDEALAPDESRVIEAHVQTCERCSAAVAEARGLMAASSRILSALDEVPAGVVPGASSGNTGDQLAALRARRAAEQSARRRSWWRNPQFVAAASVAFVALGTAAVMWQGSFRADALPGAPVAMLESDRAVASDTVALPSPPPEARSSAAVAPAEARRESKVASAPPATGSAVAGGSRDSASARIGKSLLSDVVPTGVATRAAEAEPPAQLPLPRQAGAAAPPQQGLAEQQRPQAPQQVRLQAEDRMLQRSRAAAAQANEAPAPATVPTLPRIDSAAFARLTAALGALAPADAGCYQLSMLATDEALAAAWPSGVRLDTARARVVGDTVWRRGVSLPPTAGRELEWRRVDGAAVELAWSGDTSGARLVRRVGLASTAGTTLDLRAATDVAARLADAAPAGVRAVRMSCPR
jgi:hypothetical protein